MEIMADSVQHPFLPPEVLEELQKDIEANREAFENLEPVGDVYSAADQMILEISARMDLSLKYVEDYMVSQG